jgi:hypothetical protein
LARNLAIFEADPLRCSRYRSSAGTLHALLQERIPGAFPRHDGYAELGTGERIVFETYSREVFEQSFEWIAEHRIFAEGRMGPGEHDRSTISFAEQ